LRWRCTSWCRARPQEIPAAVGDDGLPFFALEIDDADRRPPLSGRLRPPHRRHTDNFSGVPITPNFVPMNGALIRSQ
jgi:hypothetical protein